MQRSCFQSLSPVSRRSRHTAKSEEEMKAAKTKVVWFLGAQGLGFREGVVEEMFLFFLFFSIWQEFLGFPILRTL